MIIHEKMEELYNQRCLCCFTCIRLIDLAETCNSASVKVTNITSLDGCVCTSANKRFAAGDISCNEKCPTSCETCDACFQLHCS
jgi:hypothetical protein